MILRRRGRNEQLSSVWMADGGGGGNNNNNKYRNNSSRLAWFLFLKRSTLWRYVHHRQKEKNPKLSFPGDDFSILALAAQFRLVRSKAADAGKSMLLLRKLCTVVCVCVTFLHILLPASFILSLGPQSEWKCSK